MTLLEDFDKVTTEFKTQIVVALSNAATPILLDPNFQASTKYTQDAIFIKSCLSATPEGVRFIARALISDGVDTKSEPSIQACVDKNFMALAILFDPTLEV